MKTTSARPGSDSGIVLKVLLNVKGDTKSSAHTWMGSARYWQRPWDWALTDGIKGSPTLVSSRATSGPVSETQAVWGHVP